MAGWTWKGLPDQEDRTQEVVCSPRPRARCRATPLSNFYYGESHASHEFASDHCGCCWGGTR